MLPLALKRCGFDPAVSSAPFVATCGCYRLDHLFQHRYGRAKRNIIVDVRTKKNLGSPLGPCSSAPFVATLVRCYRLDHLFQHRYGRAKRNIIVDVRTKKNLGSPLGPCSSAPFVQLLFAVTGLIIYFSIAMVVLRGTLL